MRFGLIGCGDIGKLRADAFRNNANSRLVAASDLDLERAKASTAGLDCAIEPDWRDLLNRHDIDAVIVSTPPSLHAEMSSAALEAGKHVLCEKPLVRTPDEGYRLLAAADRSGKVLATGFNYRFYPSVKKARQLLDAGLIGRLSHIRSYAGYTAADHNHDWLHDPNVVGGGALRDNGIHLIDLTQYFLGGVSEVKGYTTNAIWQYEGCEDNGFALLLGPDGKVATIHASWTEWNRYQFILELYGERGVIRVSCFPMTTQITSFPKRGAKKTSQTDYFWKVQIMEKLRSYRWVVVQSFIEELDAFEKTVQGAATPLASGLDGLRAVEIAYAASEKSPGKPLLPVNPRREFSSELNKEINTPLSQSSGKNPPDRNIPGNFPTTSVVIAWVNPIELLIPGLEAFKQQMSPSSHEIIIVTRHDQTAQERLARLYPEVRLISAPPQTPITTLRSLGIQQARGAVIAVTEDHCTPSEKWLASLEHWILDEKYDVVSGPVENTATHRRRDWAAFLTEYAGAIRSADGNEAHPPLPGNNIAYRCELAMELCAYLEKGLWESFFHPQLLERGARMKYDPDLIVYHTRTFDFTYFLSQRYHFSRSFAGMRNQSFELPGRIKYGVGSLLLPPLLLYRGISVLQRKKRFVSLYLACLPLIGLYTLAGALGESIGYFFGGKNSLAMVE